MRAAHLEGMRNNGARSPNAICCAGCANGTGHDPECDVRNGVGAPDPDDADRLPPAAVYEEPVVTSGHEGEHPLRELIMGSKPSVVDLRIPGPAWQFEPDGSADARAVVARGEAWRGHVLSRVSADGASEDAVVMWAARVMDRIATDSAEFDGSAAAVDRAFSLAMAEGVGRGSRVLGAFCARYAQRTAEQAAVAASGHRSVMGMPLLMVHEVSRCGVCSEARLAAGTKVLIARGGEGVGTPFGRRADSQRRTPLPGGQKKAKQKQKQGKAEAEETLPKKAMGEAGGREQKGEAAASGERRRLGAVCCCVVAQPLCGDTA